MFCGLKYFFAMEILLPKSLLGHLKSWFEAPNPYVLMLYLSFWMESYLFMPKTKTKTLPLKSRNFPTRREIYFPFCYFLQFFNFSDFFSWNIFFIRIIYVPYTFSSNYSFIANYLHEEIKKRKIHISLCVGKFPRFEIFNFPTRREIPYASVQTDW